MNLSLAGSYSHLYVCFIVSSLVCCCPHFRNSTHSKKASLAVVLFQWETYTHCMASSTTRASPSAFFLGQLAWAAVFKNKIELILLRCSDYCGYRKKIKLGTSLSEDCRKNYFLKEGAPV